MPPPETPRKVVKADVLATPGKRRFDEMTTENGAAVSATWSTPSTESTIRGDIFMTPSTHTGAKGLFANRSLPSPKETPTPIRYTNLLPNQDSELASEIFNVLQTNHICLAAEGRDALQTICNKHVSYTRGIMKGRDVSRAAIRTKDERIAELQKEIEGLKAERETNRAVIKHLRRDLATRKET